MEEEIITKVLGIQGFVANRVEFSEGNETVRIYGEVETPPCPFGCNDPKPVRVCKTFEREVRHLDFCGRKTYLVFHGQEVECSCGRFYNPRIPFATLSKKNMTDDFAKHLVAQCKEQSCERAGILLGISGRTVRDRYFKILSQLIQVEDYWEGIEKIGLDEISLKKGHKDYCLLIYDMVNSRVVEVLEIRNKELLIAFLRGLPKVVRERIRRVSIDMWDPYRVAIRKVLPWAKITVDRFHVMQNLNKALESCRTELQKGLTEKGLAKELKKKLRWALLKGKERIKSKSREAKALEKALSLSRDLQKSYKLKESFRKIFNATSEKEGLIRLNNWIRRVKYFSYKPFLNFLKTVRNWKRYILNYFDGRLTNAVAEGLNNKVKLVKRQGYGYDNFANFRLKVLHACGSNLL